MSKVIIENGIYDGIPYNEYYLEGVDYKGLVFIQHGYESNKNRGTDYLGINLARLGYLAVSIDAFKHGTRMEEPYISDDEYKRFAEAFKVVDQTANDIIYLYQKNYQNKYDSFDLIGVSMGGFISYVVAQRCDSINKLLPVISSPYFERIVTSIKDLLEPEKYYKELSKIMDLVLDMDASKHVEKLTYNQMLILNGTEDKIISYKQSERFYNMNKNDNMRLNLYEEGHIVNREMQMDILEFIANEKVVL